MKNKLKLKLKCWIKNKIGRSFEYHFFSDQFMDQINRSYEHQTIDKFKKYLDERFGWQTNAILGIRLRNKMDEK